jgi:hypothetical protein
MDADANSLRPATRARSLRGAAEHRFYMGFAILCAAALFLGFARPILMPESVL